MVESKQQTDTDFVDDNDVDKIEISLNAVGKAGKLKVGKVAVKRRQTFQNVINFIRGQLEKGGALQSKESLFCYINSSFSPSPNERVGDLYDCFRVQNMLIVNYSVMEAWG